MRVAVRAPNWLGDAVMSLPLISAVIEAGHVTAVQTPPAFVPLYGRLGALGARPDLLEVRRGFDLQGAKRLKGWSPDLSILIPNSFSSALVALLGGAPRRVGYSAYGRRFLLTDPIPFPRGERSHQILEYLALLSPLGIETPSDIPALEVIENPGTTTERFGLSRPFAVLAPGAAYGPIKTWGSKRFGILISLLRAELGLASVLIGGPGDVPTARATAAAAAIRGAKSIDLSGRTNLGDAIEILSAAAIVVTNDSGISHLAAALARPVVVIFGPTDPARTAPRGIKTRVVSAGADCSPCNLRNCERNHICMKSVSPEDVLAAAASMVEA